MKHTILTISLFLLISNFVVTSQQNNLHVIARPLSDSILLRWAPSDYKTWTLGNQYGYKLIRYTLVRDSLLLASSEKTELNNIPLKPFELNNWENLVRNNKYAAIAAQALYGQTFKIDAGEGFNPQNVYYKSKEQEQRFAFALYAADLSPQVARASALWFSDKTAKKNEKYLYRVFIDLPDSLLSEATDTAFVFTGIPEYSPLPVPVEFTAEFGDRQAKLSWNILAQNNIYISWEIERSDDKGRSYKPITPDAIVPFFEGNGELNEYSFKFDSLPHNSKEYYYRIRGISSFGEQGPWSPIVKGKGTETIPANANIKGHSADKKGIIINWEFPVAYEANISGFRIFRSTRHDMDFSDISGKIKPNKRDFTDKKPLNTAYYKVMVYRDTIAQKLSYPYLVQLTDSIPPHAPLDLKGTADTSGIIKLFWKPNTDNDLYGYLVFRSSSGKDEYTLLTKSPVSAPLYLDSISKHDLNRSVFYKIGAVDQRQNQSELSQAIEVVKADMIAPSMPVIKEVKPTNDGIILKWINSTSADVAKHKISRQINTGEEWMDIAEIPVKKGETISVFTDTECSSGQIARYKLVAIDKSGNQSEASFSVDIQSNSSEVGPELKKIQVQIISEKGKVFISWEKPVKEVLHYKIYRKEKNSQYELYETIDGLKNSFEDNGLKLGNSNRYRIKAYYADGSFSSFSKDIVVEY